MQRLTKLLALVLTALAGTAFGQTNVYLHSTASKIVYGSSFNVFRANSTAGTLGTPATTTTNTTTGPLTQQFWPSLATAVFPTDVAGGTKVIWVSDPLASAVTISGQITPNIWGVESAAQANVGIRLEILRWSVKEGGIVSSLGLTTRTSNELASGIASATTSPKLTPTSTTFQAGDRLVIIVYGDDAKSKTQATGFNWNLFYDGNSAGNSGDTFVTFSNTITFSADSNNARSLPNN